jgi:hypothetical protein
VNQQEDRLDSWKEIADHLKREVRTASRWERERGLPVHRAPGGKRGAIYAYRSEIDAWLKKPVEAPRQVVESAPVATSSRRPWFAPATASVVLAMLGLCVLVAVRLNHEPNPQQAIVIGAEMTVLDGAGKEIWRYRFPRPLQANWGDPGENPRITIDDIDGDGKNEVLVSASYGPTDANHDELYCFTPSGRLAWHYRPRAQFNFVGRKAVGPWKVHTLAVVRQGDRKAVWVAFADPVFAPAFVASIDAEGHSQIRYISAGHVNALLSLSNKKGTFIVAGGVNNEYRSAAIAVLDIQQPPVASPQTLGNRFACTDCPAGRPVLYVLVPRSELNVALGMPYNMGRSIFSRQGRILVKVNEYGLEETADITQFLELSDDLVPKNIAFSAGYKEAHERLEKRGLINHKWSDCQEQRHPATARIWDETSGWREVQIPWVH